MENKKEICSLFLKALQATRGGEDLTALDYRKTEDGEEWVLMTYKNGYQKAVCVTADSGTALMKDILKEV